MKTKITLEEIKADKKAAIKSKRLEMKTGENIGYKFSKDMSNKAANNSLKEGELMVEVIANMAMFMDSDDDVILPGAYTKTVQERGSTIPFLLNHMHTPEAVIGNTINTSIRKYMANELNIESAVEEVTALVHTAKVLRDYNPKIYKMYENGDINQHSIGLQYIQLDVAANDESMPEEYDNWKKLINLLINPEKALETGYFWIVKELKLIENSAVLFGANSLTPTLSVIGSSEDTPGKSEKSTNQNTKEEEKAQFLYNYLK